MNAQVRHVSIACGLLFGLLLVNATYIQAIRAENLRNHEGNSRVIYKEYSRKRGPIIVDGKRVAYSKPTDGKLKYRRVYPKGKLYAHATGYYSLFGSSGIEEEKNDVLAGTDARFFVRRLVGMATEGQQRGGAVVLTLNHKAQKAAYQGLKAAGGGAAVALDPQTGEILAMVSVPSYDPNPLAAHDAEKVKQAYQRLDSMESKPLLNRAIAEVYPPGSTFKVVVAAAALSTGKYKPSTVIPAPHVLELPQTSATLRNYANEVCDPSGRMTLANALRMSCNTAFAKLAMELGWKTLREQAQAFGFGDTFEIPMESVPSVYPSGLSKPQTAQTGIGQYEVRATPLQMALVAAGIANDGTVMRPHLVDEVQGPNFETIDKAEPEEYSTPISPEVAQQLTEMMKLVVEEGTGTAAQIPGVSVAGKSGTAEHGEGNPDHAWFISFAPTEDPQVAVAVVVPNAGATGGEVAAPIAKDIMKAVLGK